jgi:hypothetical protein
MVRSPGANGLARLTGLSSDCFWQSGFDLARSAFGLLNPMICNRFNTQLIAHFSFDRPWLDVPAAGKNLRMMVGFSVI